MESVWVGSISSCKRDSGTLKKETKGQWQNSDKGKPVSLRAPMLPTVARPGAFRTQLSPKCIIMGRNECMSEVTLMGSSWDRRIDNMTERFKVLDEFNSEIAS